MIGLRGILLAVAVILFVIGVFSEEHYSDVIALGLAATAAAFLVGELGLKDAARLLDDTLDEEGEADKLLTKLATGGMLSSGINKAAER